MTTLTIVDDVHATPSISTKEKICVIGSGVGGLSTVWNLLQHQKDTQHTNLDITLIESEHTLGGHSLTFDTEDFGPIDMGFMVMNKYTYPNLLRFFAAENIEIVKTDMSFAVETPKYAWSFGTQHPLQIFLKSGFSFVNFVKSKSRFHADALSFLDSLQTDEPKFKWDITLGEFCAHYKYDESFVTGWLLPFCEAVWSSPHDMAGELEAQTILGFLRNHGFLTFKTVQWFTPRFRTRHYVQHLEKKFNKAGVHIIKDSPVTSVTRTDSNQVEIQLSPDSPFPKKKFTFDKVVFATNGHVVSKLYSNPSPEEKDLITSFQSSTNDVFLHTDSSYMPTKCKWASWNVLSNNNNETMLSYWMNSLQHVVQQKSGGPKNLFITLNPLTPIAETSVITKKVMFHPILNSKGAAAARKIVSNNSALNPQIYMAGAYLHHGFHEDGWLSGIEAARGILNTFSLPIIPVPRDPFQRPLFLTGTTFHVRNFPKHNSFKYPLCLSVFDIDTLSSGYGRQHHFGDPRIPLSDTIRTYIRKETNIFPTGAIDLLCTPETFGYSFNPISLYFIWSTVNRTKLDFIVSEVTNTPWNQHTLHLLPVTPQDNETKKFTISRPKSIFVSPFNPPPDGHQFWKYVFTLPNSKFDNFSVVINLLSTKYPNSEKNNAAQVKTSDEPFQILSASMRLSRDPNPGFLYSRNLIPDGFLHQLYIHYEAAKMHFSGFRRYYNSTLLSNANSSQNHHYRFIFLFFTILAFAYLIFKVFLSS